MSTPANPAPSSSSRRQFVGQLAAGAAALALAPATARAADAPPPGAPARGGAPGRGRGPATPPAPLPSRKLGVALVGLGSYSNGSLAPALQRTQHCAFTGVATRDPEGKGKQWAQRFGFPEKNIYAYDKIEAMKDNPDIDIVYVVTPNGLHLQDVLAAAKAGKHVITEKPMGNTVAECDKMIQACRDAGVQLGLGYRNNFDPIFQEMMRIARWKELGAVKSMSGEYSGGVQANAWRAKKDLAGGGPIMDLGVYVIHAAILAANGETPVAVTANATNRPNLPEIETIMEFTLEFANGAKCDGYTSYAGQKPGGGGGSRFRVDYERGFVNFAQAFNPGVRAETHKGPLSFPDVMPQGDRTYGQARQLDEFARCVRDRMPTSVPGEMGRQDMLVVEAIYASAANNGARTVVKA
jgi:glucose-fructose oxidoreductase